MLKVALILGVIIVLALLVYRALRPYLKLIGQFIQTVRYFQQAGQRTPPTRREGEKLVKCTACDTWVPESCALHANGSEYCSKVCLQRTAGRSRKTG
ncbi:MAG TPA: PP0621 family protein [Pyrinomonadaceae bacterium]|nr:PP0621 family protein [Pyrinomonadaceae bacterium]